MQVAWVRRKGAGRAFPRAHLQADLDIATLPGSSPSETLLADAEVIRVVSEVHHALRFPCLVYQALALLCLTEWRRSAWTMKGP